MNSLRVLGIAELGDREAPVGLNLRQEEMGEEDRFKSVLSRIAGSVNGSAASLDAEEGVASGLASTVPDGRLRRPEAGAEIPDDDLAGGAVNALLVAERHVGMLPSRLEANREFPRAVSESGIHQRVLTVASPINDEVAAPGAVLVDLPASAAPAVAEIGPPDLLPQVPDAADNEPAEPSGAGNDPSLAAAAGGLRPADLDRAPPAAIAGEPPDRRTELSLPQGDHAPDEAELGQRSPPPELPRVAVISREMHFAPAQHPDPVRFAIPPSNTPVGPAKGQAVDLDTPVSPAKGQAADRDTLVVPVKEQTADRDTLVVPAKEEAARPDASPRKARFVQTGDPLSAPVEPKSRPPNQESGLPRNVSAGIAPAVATAAVSSTESQATPPDDGAGANQGLAQRIATLPERSRATVIAGEKPSAPARRFDPGEPAPSDPQPEPPRSPLAGPAAVGPEVAARSVRPAPETPPPSPIVPRSMLQSPERDEWGRRPAGVVPAAASVATPSTESTVIPTSVAPGLGPDVLQRISGAVVEAAGSTALSAAAPTTTAGIADHAAGSAPTRALTIRIDLQDHGVVHVRLALNGNALSLRLRADREDVAEQLRHDHLKLSDTLSAAGYDTEIVAIEGRRNEVTPLQGSDTASVGTGTDGAANADRGAGGENRRPTARQPQEPNQGFGENLSPHDQEDHETRNIAQRRAGALYV